MQSLALNGTEDNAEEMEAQTAPIPASANMAIESTPGAVNARQRSRSPRRHEEEWEPFQFIFHANSVSVTRRFGAGNVAGGRRAAGVHRDWRTRAVSHRRREWRIPA